MLEWARGARQPRTRRRAPAPGRRAARRSGGGRCPAARGTDRQRETRCARRLAHRLERRSRRRRGACGFRRRGAWGRGDATRGGSRSGNARTRPLARLPGGATRTGADRGRVVRGRVGVVRARRQGRRERADRHRRGGRADARKVLARGSPRVGPRAASGDHRGAARRRPRVRAASGARHLAAAARRARGQGMGARGRCRRHLRSSVRARPVRGALQRLRRRAGNQHDRAFSAEPGAGGRLLRGSHARALPRESAARPGSVSDGAALAGKPVLASAPRRGRGALRDGRNAPGGAHARGRWERDRRARSRALRPISAGRALSRNGGARAAAPSDRRVAARSRARYPVRRAGRAALRGARRMAMAGGLRARRRRAAVSAPGRRRAARAGTARSATPE